MSQYCVPFLIVNYGCEMIVILEQRLKAQSVQGDKTNKVLHDVCGALFNKDFLEELVAPQLMYTMAATREIFDKLAHSSIMRLSTSSMDKLFDLMTMGCKYQLVACRIPRDLVRVTLGRLDNVRSSLQTSKNSNAAEEATRAISQLSSEMTDGQLADARYTLLNFFHGKRTRITLLVQENLQNKDGTFVLIRGPLPPEDGRPNVPPVGVVQYFAADGGVAREELIGHPDCGIERQQPASTCLGVNLYAAKAARSASNSQSSAASSSSPVKQTLVPPPAPSHVKAVAPAGKHRFAPASQRSSTAVSTLSNFIVQNAVKDTFKIQNLFDEGSAADSPAAPSSSGDVIHITRSTREEVQKANADLMNVVSGFNTVASRPPGNRSGADDLLDLMDGM